jgi:hypothetical protein
LIKPAVDKKSLVMKRTILLLLATVALTSCRRYEFRSPGVTITTMNDSHQPVDTIEVDYPGGSYGIGSIAPGGKHVRWVKVTGSAPLRIDFTDSKGEHQAKPLTLNAGESGSIVLHIQGDGSITVDDERVKK